MTEALKVGIAGLGTVGCGTIKLLDENAEQLSLRSGRRFILTAVSARDARKDRGLNLQAVRWYEDAAQLAVDPDLDIVVELIGGSDGIAKEVVEKALSAGKHVVTANKALIAHHGVALAKLAESNGVTLAYEAAVAGGIPVIKLMREGLSGNKVTRLQGILNGTCNYILTTMRESGREFGEVLSEAQQLGYAEADPTFDVDGVDAAHKLAILASLAFGCEVNFDAVHMEGIRSIDASDIAYAEELGYRIKLLGIAQANGEGVDQWVYPCMVPRGQTPIAHVEGVNNAVLMTGDFVGNIMAEGPGAGERPTASAVVADLVDIARGMKLPTFGLPVDKLKSLPSNAIGSRVGAYYLRFLVLDQSGVLADIAAALRDEDISVEAMIQRGRSPGEAVPLVITTHDATEAQLRRALMKISDMESCLEAPQVIRIENE
ncbi:homoserine dehydrogenase [Rhodovibrionaceae bacterium A322]